MSHKNGIFRSLTDQLRQLEAAQSELATFQGKVTKAATDEATVLADSTLSENEAIKRLGEAQKLQAIYSARITHRERLIVTLTGELEETLALAERHFSGLLNDELARRSGLEKARVLELLGMAEEIAAQRISVELEAVIYQASSVQAIAQLSLNTYHQKGSLEYTCAAAEELLANLKLLLVEMEKPQA